MAVDTRRYLSIDEATGRGKFIRAIQSSAGAGDADKIFALDSAGKIDPSFLYAAAVEPDTQIVYGTGTGIDSSSEFTFNVTTKALSYFPTSVTVPGTLSLFAANASGANIPGGNLALLAGTGGSNGAGGTLDLRAGTSQGSASGGAVGLIGGNSTGGGSGGNVAINGGISATGPGGPVDIVGGNGGVGSSGGGVSLHGGIGNSSASGGQITITGGSTTSGSGGDIVLSGGASSSGTRGNILIKAGATELMRILPNGAWSVGSSGTNYGTSGQVLTSSGSSATPVWQTLNYLETSGGTLTGYLTLHADPTLPLHAVTKQYVDNLYAGLDPKANVRVATTANIDLASAPASIDGVTLSSGNRVLVKDQNTGSQNGIYVFNGTGNAMTRSADADGSPVNEVTSGMYCFAIEGTANAESGWLLTTSDPITVDTTTLTFVQFNVGGSGTPDGSTYQLQYNNAGVLGALAFGTTGQVLTSSGTGALATWNTPTVAFADVTSTPTTLAGYGITDAYTKSEVYTQDEVLALIIALG